MSGPLDGIRVAEFGVWVAGPGAGGIPADWVADVVKIEPPEGDPCRSRVNAVEDLVADEHFLAAKSVVDVPTSRAACPWSRHWPTSTASGPRPRFRAPHVGEHTREILIELEAPADEIEALVASGVAVAGGGRGS